MMSPLTVLLPLAQQAPDPNNVKAGWLGFGVFLLVAAAVVLLVLSLRKQLKKVDFEEKADRPAGTPTQGAEHNGKEA